VGVRVLTSNVWPAPEVFGDAALFVDTFDVKALAEGVRRLVEIRPCGKKRAGRVLHVLGSFPGMKWPEGHGRFFEALG
jgi:hypothetical protein